MTIDWTKYTLAELHNHSTTIYRQGGGSRPDVKLVEIDGHYAVLKDHNKADKWFALLIGPLLVWRESKALSKLESLEGIPKLLHLPDQRSMLLEYYAAEQITRLSAKQVDWPGFFTQLQKVIADMHKLGVAHNDLRNPTNILLTESGQPVLVDLVACFCRGATWNLPKNWLFNKFCGVDQSAITKLKGKVAPELIDHNDINAYEVAGKAGMAARKLGQAIRKLTRVFFTK